MHKRKDSKLTPIELGFGLAIIIVVGIGALQYLGLLPNPIPWGEGLKAIKG